MDMQLLVEQQGEHLNTIVENADTTVGELERGNKHVDSAIKKARAVRAKKWGCFVLTIILAVVIAILVWWFAFNVSLVPECLQETMMGANYSSSIAQGMLRKPLRNLLRNYSFLFFFIILVT
jgi:hypothetical protein